MRGNTPLLLLVLVVGIGLLVALGADIQRLSKEIEEERARELRKYKGFQTFLKRVRQHLR